MKLIQDDKNHSCDECGESLPILVELEAGGAKGWVCEHCLLAALELIVPEHPSDPA